MSCHDILLNPAHLVELHLFLISDKYIFLLAGHTSKLSGCSTKVQQPAAANVYRKSYTSLLNTAALCLQPVVMKFDNSPKSLYHNNLNLTIAQSPKGRHHNSQPLAAANKQQHLTAMYSFSHRRWLQLAAEYRCCSH